MVGTKLWEEPVLDPKWDGNNKPDEDGKRDDPISARGRIQDIPEGAPGHCIGIEGLDLLARPNIRSLHIQEDLSMATNEDLHDDVVQQATDHRTKHLDGECDAWR